MKRTKNKPADDVLLCSECNDATVETKWLTIQENAPFCVWCPEDGLLKMMRWACQFGKKKQKTNNQQLKTVKSWIF